MLRARRDLGRDVRLPQLLPEDLRGPVGLRLAVGPLVGDHRLDLRVLPRVERLEGEVLELPLERVDAEPVRERRVHLERLARLLPLLLLALVLDRPHVVEAVGELDEDDADVLRHRDDHLPVVLGLGLLAALERDPGQLRDALDELRDLRRRTRRGSPRGRLPVSSTTSCRSAAAIVCSSRWSSAQMRATPSG